MFAVTCLVTMKLVSFVFHLGKHGVGSIYITWIETQFFFLSQVRNSAYTNQMKHRNVEYCNDAAASRKVNSPLFRKLDNITEDTYEVESCKKTIKLKLPIQVGFFVY